MTGWLLEVYVYETVEVALGQDGEGERQILALRRDPYPHPFRDPWEAVEVGRARIAGDEWAMDYKVRNAVTGKLWNRNLASRRRIAEKHRREAEERREDHGDV